MKVAGVILAGGLSSRMGGGEKGLRPLGERPMVAHVIERLAPQVAALALNANAEGYAEFGLPILADRDPGRPGPLAGIRTGLDWAAGLPGISHLATAAADVPFLPADLVERLAAKAAPGRIVMARSASGPQPVFGLWPVALAGAVATSLASRGPLKLQDWAARHGLAWAEFGASEPGETDPFFNVNTPADLAEAEAMLRRPG